MWRCSVCGLIYEGEEAPDVCPKCGAGKDKFEKVAEDKETLINRSRFSNGLHMELYGMMTKIVELAQKGIDDNLDPACVKIFNEEKEAALMFQRKIMAELQTHMNKSKWG
ncbi:rubredoxin-like domain-containing protein [Calorimonas adulescens]|jgi:hypothetical protein|nr:rubredoxin [Calorimonas adulescens]